MQATDVATILRPNRHIYTVSLVGRRQYCTRGMYVYKQECRAMASCRLGNLSQFRGQWDLYSSYSTNTVSHVHALSLMSITHSELC